MNQEILKQNFENHGFKTAMISLTTSRDSALAEILRVAVNG